MSSPPPFALGTGCGASGSPEEAALHGLLELIERDAAGLWWRGGRRARPIALEDAAARQAADLVAALRRGVELRRSWLLDITTDLGVPTVAAVSVRADGRGFARGLAARPTRAAAVRAALLEMSQSELGQAVVAAKWRERGEAALNDADRRQIERAAGIDADGCELLHPAGMPAPAWESDAPPGELLAAIADRLRRCGIDVYVVDLTRPAFGIPVARVVAPGLQLEPSPFVSARLEQAVGQTGGGKTYTGGVPLL